MRSFSRFILFGSMFVLLLILNKFLMISQHSFYINLVVLSTVVVYTLTLYIVFRTQNLFGIKISNFSKIANIVVCLVLAFYQVTSHSLGNIYPELDKGWLLWDLIRFAEAAVYGAFFLSLINNKQRKLVWDTLLGALMIVVVGCVVYGASSTSDGVVMAKILEIIDGAVFVAAAILLFGYRRKLVESKHYTTALVFLFLAKGMTEVAFAFSAQPVDSDYQLGSYLFVISLVLQFYVFVIIVPKNDNATVAVIERKYNRLAKLMGDEYSELAIDSSVGCYRCEEMNYFYEQAQKDKDKQFSVVRIRIRNIGQYGTVEKKALLAETALLLRSNLFSRDPVLICSDDFVIVLKNTSTDVAAQVVNKFKKIFSEKRFAIIGDKSVAVYFASQQIEAGESAERFILRSEAEINRVEDNAESKNTAR